jgi:hypothetical protein
MKVIVTLALLILVCACALPQLRPTEVNLGYRSDQFQFEMTPDWKVKEGPLATGKTAWNYYNLNLTILVQVYRDQYNATVTVARREIPAGSTLQQEFSQTYTAIASQIRGDQSSEGGMDGKKALIRMYERPWGEPWIRFKDVWIEKDGWVYVVSLKSGLNPKSPELELMEKVYTSFHLR